MAFNNIRAVNGANAIVKIGDQTIGYATGVSVNEVYGLQRIDVLGEIDSRDIEPIGRIVNVVITFIRMVNNNGAEGAEGNRGGGAVSRSLIPNVGENASESDATETITDFFEKGFDLEIQDSFPADDAKARYRVVGCRPSSQSFALTRGTLMGVNVSCEALRLVELDAEPLA
tara:strand:- start:11753 stop:12268 length:516 start_codon:yes stop_codon:yes gene_type:complete